MGASQETSKIEKVKSDLEMKLKAQKEDFESII